MSFAISPTHNLEDFPSGLTLDDKIEVFIARVDGWLLGPAREMIAMGVGYRGFALLAMVTSYFEMIAKYRDGFTKARKSGYYFKQGLQLVFPEMSLPDAEDLLLALYDKVRNGLYHVGMTKPGVILVDPDFCPGSIAYKEEQGTIAIAPDTLVDDLSIHFKDFANELRNPANQELRSNFEKRFDRDNY
jgi:hypothetical protein